MNWANWANETSSPNTITTASADVIIFIALPTMWTFAQRGTTKSRTSSDMPFLSQHSSVTGITAADEAMESPVRYAGAMFHRQRRGPFPATAADAEYRRTRNTMVSAQPVPMTFAIVSAIAPIFPETVISLIIVIMYIGSPGITTRWMVRVTILANSSAAAFTRTAFVATMPTPTMNASASAVSTSHTGGIFMSRYGSILTPSPAAATAPFAT